MCHRKEQRVKEIYKQYIQEFMLNNTMTGENNVHNYSVVRKGLKETFIQNEYY